MSDATTLPAGRELDARIAEKVFGAMIHEGEYDDYMTLPGERPVSDQRPVPPYSTDIAAAWPVKERVREMMGVNAPLWDARIAPIAAMAAAEAAEFICRAALAAVEVSA